MSSKIDHDGKIVVEPAYKRVVRDANACGLNVKEKQSAATKAGDFKCPKCGWLARNADGCAVCTPPAEPALAAEGAVVLSDAERAELCDFCIWLGDHQENPGTRRRLGRIAQIFNATAAPDPAQSADTRTEKQRFIQRVNYSLWMENQREGCEPSADWQEGYREGKEFAEALQELREASEQSADTPSGAIPQPFAFYDRDENRFWVAADDCRDYLAAHPEIVELYTREQMDAASRPQPARGEVAEAAMRAFLAEVMVPERIDAIPHATWKRALEAAARVRATSSGAP